MTDISIQRLRKAYGNLEVIHGIDLAIEPGEFVALVGPSGCGKSTLLRMIAGLEQISGGDLFIGNLRMNDVPPKDRDIAMVFQGYALYPHMTVADNMGFSLRLRKVAKDEKDRRVREAAAMLGLENLLQRYPKELSGGQRQRVAMGRAIVRNPKVFLFDEPLSNLDAKLRVHTRAEIKSLHRRLGTTTVYVTHDQIEAMTMADRIVVMNAGNVEQVGTPLELYDEPSNMFVAGFLGSPAMNFIPGSYDPATGNFSVRNGPAINVGANRWNHGGEAMLGIRPEDFTLGGELALPIELIEPTGSDTHVVFSLGESQVTAVFHDRIAQEVGETMPVSLGGRAHLFDPRSSQRIAARVQI
ncbi:sugar ABC transporter ATP-binding protein [Nitratireductor aestuarii]|uniref:Sugar ABC transporter ATP-binding protein n=1 Tax=Nitratireductor aestuarii TaxID=1735103 RepID=A0A916W8H3_9HYPH|nr:sn-glycerol-3-phosphate ABC transporter ATP-binding protein UgpC [Nitratireductor aestuarii]GGA76750.1 sugar ABC transporter ATP-binding protein [Nitratireductor aestuarii]